MAMNIDDPNQLSGVTVVGDDGQKLGSVDAVYYDNATDRPEWVAVRSGLFGTRVTLVPLRRADYDEDALRVPFNKIQLRNAPYHDPGRELSAAEEADLYRYYGIDYGTDDAAATVEMRVDRTGVTEPADERPVADTPVERIRLGRQTATEQRTLEGGARGERIDDDMRAARFADPDVDRIDPERDGRFH
jgi:hypothetical protein